MVLSNVCFKGRGPTKMKVLLCSENRVRERNVEFERQRRGVQPWGPTKKQQHPKRNRCVVRIALGSEISPLKVKGEASDQNAKISLCRKNRVRERNVEFERQSRGVQPRGPTKGQRSKVKNQRSKIKV